MRTDPHARPARAAYADREPTQPPNWHGLVVWDVFLNALATGLFLTAAMADLAAPALFAPAAAWAYPLALVLLLADLACLVLDLGDPLRFHHMLRVFKPSSPMSLGTWFLSAFSLPLTALVAADLLGLAGWGRTVLVAAGLPFAFGSAAYKGVLFSTTAQPGWRDARWMGGYHVTSALAIGAAGLLAVATLAGEGRAASALRLAAGLLLALSVVPLALVTAELWPALKRGYSPRWLAAVGGLAYVGGVLIPLAAMAVGGAAAVLGAAALAMAGAFAARHAIVLLPQQAPRPRAS